MSRLGALFWLALVATTGFAMFTVKYTVQNLEDELKRVHKQTVAEQLEIRVLNAEWTYLTQPERLAELNRQFLALTPITIKQLQRTIGELPERPPAPATEPVAESVSAPAGVVPTGAVPSPAAAAAPLPVTPAVLSTPAAAAAAKASPAVVGPAVVGPAVASPAVVSPAVVSPAGRSRSLDALFSQVAGGR